jgi:lipopolysaccharide/colanic/teichoic acid biosynthesis glycosyltransferase
MSPEVGVGPGLDAAPDVILGYPAARTRRGIPRLVEVVVAGSALVVLAPLMAFVAVLVRCTSRGSVLFAQTRLGQGGKPFEMLKFRTMYANCDDQLHREYVQKLLMTPAVSLRSSGGLYKLVDDPRITRLGRWLRRSSLDELPQLINVVRGEMSLVGPRPALPWEAALYEPRYARRLDVRPGITGLWQVSGRNRLTAAQALDLDVEYVDRRSFRLDLAILCRTIPTVLGRDGAG